jgi:hypothetical protein
MAVTEKLRHELFNEVERVLGPRHAETLMELLPPVGWADVATKHDLDALGAATSREFDLVRATMATKDDLHGLRRDVIGWLLVAMGIQTAVIGLLFTVAGS